ncbi:TolC family outer membrane protein [Sulfuriferula nivalis]|uniref:TolC family outer membrane protein n=1 Tax=Sulfuriferula nivalis TaxID=2675298 RepID=UPI001389DD64|nr:TolC family outer membrane protein [Sulfuriferula nivalis]
MLFRNVLTSLILITFNFVVIYPASALSLKDAVSLAEINDPVFLSAQANLLATQARSSQAVANLLPQISATANTTGNHRNYQVRDGSQSSAVDNYNSNGAQLSATQPLWHHANWIAVTQADKNASQATYQLAAAEQDLLLRLAQAWFDVMSARDVVVFSDAQVIATKQQWDQIKRASELGVVNGVAVEEAHAKYDQAVADDSGAQTDQLIKVAALEQIIGPSVALTLPALNMNYVATDPRSGTFELWLKHAEEKSPLVLAALRGFDAASEEIRKQRAGHEPTLDLVANYGRNGQQVGSFPGQSGFTIVQSTVALQLSVPIYSGGGQSAKVAEAMAMQEKARMDLETAKRNVLQACRQAWFGWQADNARQTAALQYLKFSSLNLHSTIQGQSHDLKTELDVLTARQQVYSATKDLQKARYDMMMSQLKLKATAGELVDSDLLAFDAWMVYTKQASDVLATPQPEARLSRQVM